MVTANAVGENNPGIDTSILRIDGEYELVSAYYTEYVGLTPTFLVRVPDGTTSVQININAPYGTILDFGWYEKGFGAFKPENERHTYIFAETESLSYDQASFVSEEYQAVPLYIATFADSEECNDVAASIIFYQSDIPVHGGGIEVDKSGLELLLKKVWDFEEEAYTDNYYQSDDRFNGKDSDTILDSGSLWSDFIKSGGPFQNAMAVYKSPGAGEELVSDTITALGIAIDKLISTENINATPLYEELQISNMLEEQNYTPETWPAFALARTIANDVFARLYDEEGNATPDNRSGGTTAAAVSVAAIDLAEARANLYSSGTNTGYANDIVDTTAKINILKEIISRTSLAEGDYTEASWSVYQSAFEATATAPTLMGMDSVADKAAVNTYKVAYTTLYNAYYAELIPKDEISVELSWVDLFNLKAPNLGAIYTYKANLSLEGNYSLAAALDQAGLSFQRTPGENHLQSVYINGVHVDKGYAGGTFKTLPEIVLHPGDKVAVLYNNAPQTWSTPTIYLSDADFWQYEDGLKVASFKQGNAYTVEAGQPFILEVTEASAAFGANGEALPADGKSIYISHATTTSTGICPVTNPAIMNGQAIVTDAEGKAEFALYEEGWYLVAAYDLRQDIAGDKGDTQKKGIYYSVNSGALIWIHIVPSSNPAAVKADLKAKLDDVYQEYPESYFRENPLPGLEESVTGGKNSWNDLKAAYDTAATSITLATTIGEAHRAQDAGIVAIKAIQKDATEENAKNVETLRGYLGRLPDDSALITKSVQGIVDSAVSLYDKLSSYQKTRLSKVEIDTCEMLKTIAQALPDAENYNLGYEIVAEDSEAKAAIEDMIAYLQAHNTIKTWSSAPTNSYDFGHADNQGKPDANKLFQFNVNTTTTNAAFAAPDSRITLITDIGRYAYLHVRQSSELSGVRTFTTSGAAWTISDEDFELSESGSLGYAVTKNMTVKVEETEYELKRIEFEGIDESSVGLSTATSFIDRTTYKGRPINDSNVNISFPNSQLAFTMPYNDVNLVFHWGTVGSEADIEAAREAATADLKDKYNSFDLSKYDDAGKIALQAARQAGEDAIDKENTLEAIAEAKRVAIAAMMAVKTKVEMPLPPGAVLPTELGDVVGQVKISVRNDTYPGGDFRGKLFDKWYDLYEKDTMMTAILRALAIEGYQWNASKQEAGYDYGIYYIASIEKGSKKLGEFSGQPGSGWMGTLNDWFVNESFQAFGVKNKKLENGDLIEVQYTQNLGEDIGGTWNNSDTSLNALSVSGGMLSPSFKGSVKEYILLIDKDRAAVTLTPTASNKNYLVKTFLNYYDRESAFYKRTESISVKDGDVIYIGVGEKSWPSMNKQGSEARDYTGTKYTIRVKQSAANSVIAMISLLPEPDRITYTTYKKDAEKIMTARIAYDLLSNKSEVTNYTKLTAAEAKIKYYADIDAVRDMLAAIPSASKITAAHESDVKAADTAYKKLNADQKKYITTGDVTNYNAAIDRLKALGVFSEKDAPSKIKGADEVPKEGGAVYVEPEAIITGNEGKARVNDADGKQAVQDLKDQEGTELLIQPKLEKEVDKLTVEVPKTVLRDVAEQTDAVVTIKSNLSEISFSKEALKAIAKEAGSTVSFIVEKLDNDKLSEENKGIVGDNPVFELSVMVDGKQVKDFNGTVKVSLPYTLKQEENPKKLTVYYIDEKGKATEMSGAYYDEKTASLVFNTNHFSTFAIVYNVDKMIFEDVKEEAWYYDAVNFVVDRNLFSGVSETKFAPNMQMTRSMLVSVLYRLEGSPAVTGTNNFTDVKSGQWYTDGVIWANGNGIVSGLGNGRFGTNDNVTREQMAVILHNYAKYKKYNVEKTTSLSVFTDASALSSWAAESMKWANAEGLIQGRTATTLVPGGNATRAEVAAILKRFVETR